MKKQAIKKALYEEVALLLIEKLKEGIAPWQKSWKNRPNGELKLPYNPTTGKAYKGMNSMWLDMQGRSDPRWLTFKQAQTNGWSVRKGEKAKTINYFKLFDIRTVRDEKGKPVLDEKGKSKKIKVVLDRPIITTAWVFNAEQIEGIPPLKQEKEETKGGYKWDNVDRAELIIKHSKATLRHGGNEAFYSPSSDFIQMPEKEQFKTASGYYGTLLHELGHWTGHETRLNRDIKNSFGSAAYAKEELVAEIASYMVRSEIGLNREFDNTASYVDSWVKVLEKEPFEIFKASSNAQKVFDYILDFEWKRDLKEKKEEYMHSFKEQDKIDYKGEIYEVKRLNPKSILFQVQQTGEFLTVKKTDGIYKSLLNAKSEQHTKKQEVLIAEKQQAERLLTR